MKSEGNKISPLQGGEKNTTKIGLYHTISFLFCQAASFLEENYERN